jgi:hypothetical protein
MAGLLQHQSRATIEMCLRPLLALTPPMAQPLPRRRVTQAPMVPDRVTRNNLHWIPLGPGATAIHCHLRLSHLILATVAARLGYVGASRRRLPSHPSAVCLATQPIAKRHLHRRIVSRTFIVRSAEAQDGRHMRQSKCFRQRRPRTLIFSRAYDVPKPRFQTPRPMIRPCPDRRMSRAQYFPHHPQVLFLRDGKSRPLKALR